MHMEQESAIRGNHPGPDTTELCFPAEADLIFQEAEELRRMPATDRFRAILDVMEFGEMMMKASPCQAYAEEHGRFQEEEWQRIQKEVFARHGR